MNVSEILVVLKLCRGFHLLALSAQANMMTAAELAAESLME